MTSLTIGQVAKQTGISIDSIRFYEREKLISSPPRRLSGYRQYSEDTVKDLLFIRHAKEMGFTLREISDLLSLRSNPCGTAAEVKQKTLAKINDINNKICMMQLIKNELMQLTMTCTGDGLAKSCPIINALEAQ